MRLVLDALTVVRRGRRYRRLLRAERAASTDRTRVRRDFIGPAGKWGLPAVPPLLAFLSMSVGDVDGGAGSLPAAAALVPLLLVAGVVGAPAIREFDLLHAPSRRAWAMGHLLRHLPWLAWCGGMVAATGYIAIPALVATTAGVALLVAGGLAPLAIALHGGARRISRRSGHRLIGNALPIFAVVLGAEAVEYWELGSPWTWGIPLLAGLVGLAMAAQFGQLLATLRELSALIVVAGTAAAPAAGARRVLVRDGLEPRSGYLVIFLIAVTVALIANLVVQLRMADRVEVRRGLHRGDSEPGSGGAAFPPRPRCAGEGLLRARWRYVLEHVGPVPAASRESRRGIDWVRSWAGLLFGGLLTVGRGPIVIAMAVSGSTGGQVDVLLALLAAFWASRLGSVDNLDLDDQLWLFGVDLRDQVLHGLRCLLLVGVLPTLVTGAVAVLLTDPTDPARQTAVALTGAAFLLRVGLPGVMFLRECTRIRLAGVWLGLLLASLLLGRTWALADALSLTLWAGAIGLAGLIVRLARLRESRLRGGTDDSD